MMFLPPTEVRAFEDAFQTRLARQADIWFKDGEFPKAVQLLKLRAETSPGDYDAWTDLGWMTENLERYDEAQALYVRFAAENPGDPDRRLALAEYYGRRKKYAETVSLLGPSFKEPRAHPNHWRLLARAYEKTNRLDDSARVWREYLAGHRDLTAEANLRRVEAKIKASRAGTPPSAKR